MENFFSKEKILNSAIGPYDYYCKGYSGRGNYLITPIMTINSFRETFTHAGSHILDSIIAYDRAESCEAYVGQINMINVSSFCGPEGMLWGYDIAKETKIDISTLLSVEKIKIFNGIEIRAGENLRIASRALFGEKNDKHFPFLPGSHVPCAGRFYHQSGPTNLYGAFAIGIPENRENGSIVFMEDVGYITFGEGDPMIKEKIILNSIKSVLEIGKNHGIKYKEIFIDFISKQIPADEIGCVLLVAPYFLLAKKAFNDCLFDKNLDEWINRVKRQFLNKQ